MTVDLARETALKILYDIDEKGAYSNIAVHKHLEEGGMKTIDRSFATELVYGTVKWKLSLDWIIGQFSSIKLKKLSPWIRNILRVGIYQILYMDRIPESAACNESVKLSRKYGHAAASGYVNAVLRNVVRNRESIRYPDPVKECIRYLAVRHSHPEWMVKNWLERYGKEFTEELLASNNAVPDFSVRVNRRKLTREQLLEALREEGVEASAGKYAEEAVILKNPSSITRLASFQQGYFQVQDESSMIIGKVLDPKPGELVMDVCAAPGGKATHIAQLMNDTGTVVARDIHAHKIQIMEETARRLGLHNIKTEVFDAAQVDGTYTGKADRVLVDAPCTGLGIIRRKPDIKWARNSADTKEITALQAKILHSASEYVRPGGVLVYSTCTLEPEENTGTVEDFVRTHPEFELAALTGLLPESLKSESAEKGYIQLFPNLHQIDGFFIARMKKRGSRNGEQGEPAGYEPGGPAGFSGGNGRREIQGAANFPVDQ